MSFNFGLRTTVAFRQWQPAGSLHRFLSLGYRLFNGAKDGLDGSRSATRSSRLRLTNISKHDTNGREMEMPSFGRGAVELIGALGIFLLLLLVVHLSLRLLFNLIF